ncbi:MAG: hypothetical protein CSA39_05525 [Flavobacteriales bacterium]|nr:MAG: hypothetical protein CSA39_05525 [Flavobacteriales bacterium]
MNSKDKMLHILNGNSTLYGIKKGNISGDVVIWREMLAMGPLEKKVGSKKFWDTRIAFLEEHNITDKKDYKKKVIDELEKFKNVSAYQDVVLWFEYNLFCQFNLLAACSYLLRNFTPKVNYHLICTGHVTGYTGLTPLSLIHPKDFKKLLKKRVTLTKTDLMYADWCWQTLVENDIKQIKRFDFSKNEKFNYLNLAISQHLLRFNKKGKLNQIDTKILQIIKNNNLKRIEIIKNLLIWQSKKTVYGFGDLQYEMHLDNLSAYYEIKDYKFELNEKGKSILNASTC